MVALSVVVRATLRPPARHSQHTRLPTKWKSTRQSRRYPVATQGHTAPDPGTVARPGWGNSWAHCPGDDAHVRRQPKSRLPPLTTVMTGVPVRRAAGSITAGKTGVDEKKGTGQNGRCPLKFQDGCITRRASPHRPHPQLSPLPAPRALPARERATARCGGTG